MTDNTLSHDAQGTNAPTPEATPGASSASNNTNGSNKRKRGAGAAAAAVAAPSTSSRGVANLTPEQLERKRANDREAQRAIRERTKQQIERLNERIKDLESSQPYRDLQAVIAQKDAVQQENDDIKRQLASFMATFQRYLNVPSGLEELAAAAERNALPYPPSDQPHILSQQDPFPPPPGPPDHASPHVAPSVGSPMSQASITRPFQFGNVQQQNQNRSWMSTSNEPFEQHPRNIHPDLAAYNHNDERLGVDFLLENKSPGVNGLSPSPPAPGHGEQQQPGGRRRGGHYSMIPARVSATCPLDAILLDAVAERTRTRTRISNSTSPNSHPSTDIVGPLYPDWNLMLNKNSSTPTHPVSKLHIDIIGTFPDLSKLPEQVAVVYIMFLLTRWEVEPTRENYERLPEWVRPLPSQLFTPHPVWIDYLPWPRLRDYTVQSSPFPNFDTFFIPYTTTLSLNWPYAPSDVLIPTSGPPRPMTHPTTIPASAGSPSSVSSHGGGGASPDLPEPMWKLNPAFETHLRDLKNWSLGPLFRDTFPDWVKLVRIKDR